MSLRQEMFEFADGIEDPVYLGCVPCLHAPESLEDSIKTPRMVLLIGDEPLAPGTVLCRVRDNSKLRVVSDGRYNTMPLGALNRYCQMKAEVIDLGGSSD